MSLAHGTVGGSRRRVLSTAVACALILCVGLVSAAHDPDHFSEVVVVYQGESEGFEVGYAYVFRDDVYEGVISPFLPIIIDRLPDPGPGDGGAIPPERPECDEALASFWDKLYTARVHRNKANFIKTLVVDLNGEELQGTLANLMRHLSSAIIQDAAAGAILTAMEAMDCDMPSTPK
ncbi:MAG: hypothetical protein KF813_01285 [Trueperaceae bacterium]|nr:hypothetical protein [Trueperaceae bacterium]